MLLEKYAYSTVSPGSGDYLDYLALRYEVFCDELGRIPSSGRQACGVQLESDEYDVHSLHVLCRSTESGLPVACSRLILPGPNGLNVGARYALARKADSSAGRVGEIGRLALSHRLRRFRSASDGEPLAPDSARVSGRPSGRNRLRDGPAVALGLYREIFRLAGAYGITHCYAAMEPALARLLNRLGFPFDEAGPLNTEVHPPRQPYVIGAQETRSGLASRNSCLYQFMFGPDENLAMNTVGARLPPPAEPVIVLPPPRAVATLAQQRSYPHPRFDGRFPR